MLTTARPRPSQSQEQKLNLTKVTGTSWDITYDLLMYELAGSSHEEQSGDWNPCSQMWGAGVAGAGLLALSNKHPSGAFIFLFCDGRFVCFLLGSFGESFSVLSEALLQCVISFPCVPPLDCVSLLYFISLIPCCCWEILHPLLGFQLRCRWMRLLCELCHFSILEFLFDFV